MFKHQYTWNMGVFRNDGSSFPGPDTTSTTAVRSVLEDWLQEPMVVELERERANVARPSRALTASGSVMDISNWTTEVETEADRNRIVSTINSCDFVLRPRSQLPRKIAWKAQSDVKSSHVSCHSLYRLYPIGFKRIIVLIVWTPKNPGLLHYTSSSTVLFMVFSFRPG